MRLFGLRVNFALLSFSSVILLALILWPELVTNLGRTSGFMPHGFCFMWEPDILLLHVVSDLIIWLSYMGLAGVLALVVLRYRTLFSRLPIWIGAAFSGFIFWCGITHVLGVVVIWTPLYWLDGGVKALTALASVGTLIGIVIARKPLSSLMTAAVERDLLLHAQQQAVAQLQAALATREMDLTTLTEEITRQRDERARLHTELEQSNRRYRALAANFPGGSIALVRPDLTYIFADGEAVGASGQDATRLTNAGVGDTVTPELRALLRAHYRAAFAGARQDLAFTWKSRIYNLRLAPIAGADRVTEIVLAVSYDITERVQTEQALRKSEARFQAFMDNSPAAAWITDVDRIFRYVSSMYTRLFDVPPDLIGRPVNGVFAAHFAEEYMANIARVVATRQVLETTEQAPRVGSTDGTFIVYKFPLDRGDGQLDVGGVAVDITERVVAQAALRASEERYRLITEYSHDLIELLDLDAGGVIIYASPSHAAVYGQPARDYLGRRGIATVHPEDDELARRMWGELLLRGSTYGTIRLPHGDGSWRWIELTLRQLTADGRRMAVAVGRDVTERQKLQQQYVQAQKMESIGQLAGGIAHDFNNLLTAILGTAELARLEAEGQLRQDLDEIMAAAQRAVKVTRQLLTFARKQIIELQILDLNRLILGTGRMLQRMIEADRELTFALSPTAVMVRADVGQLEQVIVNLVINARDAMAAGGRLTIETANVLLDESYIRMHPDVVPGAYVLLTVTDTGTGMTPEVQQHLFEPFYTTKARDKGTGLGLPTVYGIVKQHRGYIWVYSEVGVGTSVKIYLPRVMEQPNSATVPDAAPVLAGTETILLVEDEEQVRHFATRVLTALGYTVYQAENGAAALRLVAELGDRVTFDLLITDVVMPHMGGRALADTFAARSPTSKVLFISGYTDNTMIEAGMIAPGITLLQKPFSSDGLAQQVRAVLHGP